MVEVGSVWVKLGIKSTLGKDVKKATTQLNKLGASAKNVSERVSQLGKDLTIKLAAPLSLVSGIALKSAANIEQYSIAFENLFGSAKKAGDEIVYILDFAKRTPFQITGLVAADKRLSAFGINARDVLTTLGDTAAALGVPLMQSVEAFADAQTGEFERVKEFGIKALEVTNNNYQALGVGADAAGQTALMYTDKHGKNRVALIDRNNREIVSSTLLSIWNSKYAGAMEMQSKSLAGIASNIKDNFTIAGLSIMGFNQQTGQFTDDSLFMSIKRVSEAARSLSERFAELSPFTQKLIVGITALGIAIPVATLAIGALSGVMATGATVITGTIIPALGTVAATAGIISAPLLAVGAAAVFMEKKFHLFSDTATILNDLLKTKFIPTIKEKVTAAFDRMLPRIKEATEFLHGLKDAFVEITGINTGFLDEWHQRAEDIRAKNEELTKSINDVTDGTIAATNATNEFGKSMDVTDTEIPGYAGHIRELLEAGLAGEAGFLGPEDIAPGLTPEQFKEKYGEQKYMAELEAEKAGGVGEGPVKLQSDIAREFADIGPSGLSFQGLTSDMVQLQPELKNTETDTKEIEKNTKDINTATVENGTLIFQASQDIQKAVRESKPRSTGGFSGFFRSPAV